ncbi:MAG: type I-C CRISPR-associated protein Cas8c/Csd1 [Clostridiales bacterium]|jgi:CRISPR-associated protein Csd1|nr:type I-C CRISPR-associated protein Cas8c/Csd1 [Clostridiales bacterium]
MGLFSNLLETYEKCQDAVGIVPLNDDGEADEKKTFLPFFHTTSESQSLVCVTIDGNGKFVSVVRNEKQTTIIPCSEESAGRTGTTIQPHPLCDQLAYVDKDFNKGKFEVYKGQLAQWKSDNIKLNAIYTYLTENSVVEALKTAGLFKESEFNKETGCPKENINKIGVRFSVQVEGDVTPNVWEDKALRDLWINYYYPIKIQKTNVQGIDYLGGKPLLSIVRNYPKNIIGGNPKLISCNDEDGFTYRGRFVDQDEAILVDSVSSEKVHSTLKWLVNNYGLHTEKQVVVIWAVDDNTEEIKPFGNSLDLFSDLPSVKIDSEILSKAKVEIDANYAEKVAKVLRGFGSAEKIKEHGKKIVIVIFDVANSGRMSVTFYQEFPEDTYLESIARWHEESAWHLSAFQKGKKAKGKKTKGKEESKFYRYIGCPSFEDIVFAIYGNPRVDNDKAYKVLEKNVKKQLLECMFGSSDAFPKSFVDMAASRASRPLSFTYSDGKNKGSFNEFDWRRSLDITCSLTKKYIKRKQEEEIQMELDKTRTDRDYLYGRLLAVADQLEARALYEQDKKKWGKKVFDLNSDTDSDVVSNVDSDKDSSKDNKRNHQRATNAIRLMSSFSTKPFSTWGVLHQQLNPYISQLENMRYYILIINEINSLFEDGDYISNKPLSPVYLLGYSAQYRALSNKNKTTEEKDNDVTE